MITYKKEEDNIILCRYNSSTILQTVYYKKNKFLYIFFKRGNVYSYQPFPLELYNEFEKAKSQGKFLHKFIKSSKSISTRKETQLKEHELESMINTKFDK